MSVVCSTTVRRVVSEETRKRSKIPRAGQVTLMKSISSCTLPVQRFIVPPWFPNAGLPCVVLEGGSSAFWRPQRGKPSSWLATAEAVHLTVTRLLRLQGCQGDVDDLLFFFKFFYTKIRSRYKVRPTLSVFFFRCDGVYSY